MKIKFNVELFDLRKIGEIYNKKMIKLFLLNEMR